MSHVLLRKGVQLGLRWHLIWSPAEFSSVLQIRCQHAQGRQILEKGTSTFIRAIKPVIRAVQKSRVLPQEGMPRLFFLCGANDGKSQLSYRRKETRKFIENQIPGSYVIIAEHFFERYKEQSATKNSLDFEHVLSDISDEIIIILESESAICELGAFSHQKCRKNLIVINDKSFQHSTSFINTGPIHAIRESAGEGRIIWYKMGNTKSGEPDPIGTTFPKIKLAATKKPPGPKPTKTNLDPSQTISKNSILFVHDLIFLMTGTKFSRLIDCLKIIFGDGRDYSNVNKIITILDSLGFVTHEGRLKDINSNMEKTFFHYGEEQTRIMSGTLLHKLRTESRAR